MIPGGVSMALRFVAIKAEKASLPPADIIQRLTSYMPPSYLPTS